jgi:sterol desaturase/sphingolipid hydroxylase (fatty acid hydroxylase superfamily)
LNVVTFCSLYVVMGFFTSWFYEIGRSHRFPERALSARSAVRVPLQVASAVIGVFGVFVFGGVAMLGIGSALLVVALGLLAWLGNRYIVETGYLRRLSLPAVVQPLGLLVVPGLAGLVLTARNITEILLN